MEPETFFRKEETMTKFELLTMLYSIEALLEEGSTEAALKAVRKAIEQAEKEKG